MAQLKHAEGQILEEREKTAAAKREIQKREQRIVELRQEHSEELKCRLRDRSLLYKQLRNLVLPKYAKVTFCFLTLPINRAF